MPNRPNHAFPAPAAVPTVPPSLKPILFQLGDFSLHTFGLLVALGFLTGLWVASRNAVRAGFGAEFVYDLAPWLIIGGLVGARALYVASYWDRDFAGRPLGEIFAVWRVADCLAPSIALGHVFGRLGCLANGCCYGHATEVAWAIRYPRGHETFPISALTATAVHPAQLYEAALNLAFFGALLWLFHRRRFDGQVFAVYLIGYAFIRTVAELFRGDYSQQSAPLAGTFTPGQKTSAVILALGFSLWWLLRKQKPAVQS